MPKTRTETPADAARRSALESDFATLYVLAGLTDAFAAQVKEALLETREKAAKAVHELQGKPTELEAQAKGSAEELARFWKALPEQVKTLPDSTKSKLAELSRQAQTLVSEASGTYSELAGRGKRVVDDAIGSAKRLSSYAEKQASDLGQKVDPAFEKVQETVVQARQQVSGKVSSESVTSRTAARAAANRAAAKAAAEATAAEKDRAAVRKAAAQKAAATRAARRAAAQAAVSEAATTEETPADHSPAEDSTQSQ